MSSQQIGIYISRHCRTSLINSQQTLQQDSQVTIMEQNQPQQRQAAAQEFQKSLHQLEDVLQENPTGDEIVSELHSSSESDPQLDEDLIGVDLAAFEEAVADIEQYLEEKKK